MIPGDMTFGDSAERPVVLGLVGAAAAVIVVVALSLDHLTFDLVSGGLTLLVLGMFSMSLLHWIGHRDHEPAMARLFQIAFVTKIVASLVRYYVNEVVYGGSSDAGVYAIASGHLASSLRAGRFMAVPPGLENFPPESQRVGLVLGFAFVLTGTSMYAGIFVMTTICFWGQVLMCRALRIAVPDADHRHYALLVMFLPSLLYWPSSIGKDAMMIGAIGLASYGAAQLLAQAARASGLLIFLAGVLSLGFIRPHLSLIAVVALLFGAAVGAITRVSNVEELKASGVRIAAVVVLLFAAAAATTQVSEVLGEGTNESSLSGMLARTTAQSEIGGSSFSPPAVTSPVDLPWAVVTVLVRPFPWEAGNVQGLMAAAEGMMLLGIVVACRRRLAAWPAAARRNSYLVYAAAFTFVFIVAFSYIGNFGILVRQRTQMLPLFLAFLAMPPRTPVNAVGRAVQRRLGERRATDDEPEPVSLARRPLSPGTA